MNPLILIIYLAGSLAPMRHVATRINDPAEATACPTCKQDGMCVAAPFGHCYGTVASCAASVECARLGNCGAPGSPFGGCNPTDEGCAKSLFCKLAGMCRNGGTMCVATQEGCAASDSCKRLGQCKARGEFCAE